MGKHFKNQSSGYTHTPPPTRLHAATGINNIRFKNKQIKSMPLIDNTSDNHLQDNQF